MISRNSLGELAGTLRNAGVSDTSIDIAATILENFGQFDPNEDLPKDLEDLFNGHGQHHPTISNINFIPSDHKGICHDLLITVCAGERNFDLNTMETIALCINCHSTIKAVIIATDYWVEKEFNKWRKPSFKALHDRFGIIFLSLLPTPAGGQSMK